MSVVRHEFCSEAWVAEARRYVREAAAAASADLAGISLTFNEVFTDAPAHLEPDDQGRIGWYLRITDGEIEVARGILKGVDVRITADYDWVLPLARTVFADDPEAAEAAQASFAEGTASGKVRVEGDREAGPSQFPWLAGLHDALARVTA
jgi:hypothetical protein